MSNANQPIAGGGPPATAHGDASDLNRVIAARVHTVGCSGLRTVTIRGFRLSSGDGADVAGFDLGPSPEEHLLAALGSSLAQTVAHVACTHDLSIDRIDINLSANLAPDQKLAHIAGHIDRVTVSVCVTSEDAPEKFATLAGDVLHASPLAALISAPITLTIQVEPLEPGAVADDWQI